MLTYRETTTKVRLAAASRNLITPDMKGRAMLFQVLACLEAAEPVVASHHIPFFVLFCYLTSRCFSGPFLPS